MSDNEEVYNNNNNNLSNEMSQMRLDITNLTNMFAQFMQHSSGATVVKTEVATSANPVTTEFSSISSSTSIPPVPTFPVATASPTISSSQAALTSAISVATATSSFNNRQPVRMTGVKPIALIINSTTFKTFRDDFLQVALENGLMSYINNTYEQVCSIVQKRNPNVDRESIELSVQTQSSSMTAALQRGLHSHWGRHNDSMLQAATLPENANIFIEYNINWIWSDILKTYQTVSKFSRVNLMSSMFHVKHNINDNPSITLEKLMKIKRQLEIHNHVIDDATFSGILFYTIPDTMEIVKQTLAESNNDTTDHIFKAMQRFYEARINKPSSNHNNANNNSQSAKTTADGTTTVFIFSAFTGEKVCFQFQQNGRCNKDKCPYIHETKTGRLRGQPIKSVPFKTKPRPKPRDKSKDPTNSTTTESDSEVFYTFIELFTTNSVQVDNRNQLVYDSGASAHICCDIDFLTETEDINPIPMIGVHRKISYIKEIGNLKINKRVTLTNVCYVPGATANLISASRLLDKGLKIETTKEKVTVSTPGGTVMFTFKREGGIFIMPLPTTLVDYDDENDKGYKLSVATAARKVIPKKKCSFCFF